MSMFVCRRVFGTSDRQSVDVYCHYCWTVWRTGITVPDRTTVDTWYERNGWKQIDGHWACPRCQKEKSA